MTKIKLHKDLAESGLASVFDMKDSVLDGDPRGEFLGKVVRYKAFDPRNGTQTRDCDFEIGGVQSAFDGSELLRGYAVCRETGEVVDTFGRPIRMKDVVIVGV
jgi:hypothetical protein